MKNQGMQQGDLCLVTGITGYVASWISKDLLEEGYRVRGTVRSLKDEKKIQKMRELLPGAEFVEADLRSKAGWEKATEGCRWVFTYPKFLMWILKFFSADVASIYPLLGKETLRETKYPEVYHYHYTDFSQMVRDTMDDLLEKKAIQAKGK